MQKVRITYSKSKEAIYISHYDLFKTFEKIFKRADVLVSYSEKNPNKPEMLFVNPLEEGIESIGEILEVILQERYPLPFLIRQLNSVVPSGITILSAEYVNIEEPSLVNRVYAGVYQFEYIFDDMFEGKNKKEIEDIKEWYKNKMKEYLSQNEILVLKKSKDRMERIDIKPQIIGYTFLLDLSIQITLKIGKIENLKPDYIMYGFSEFIDKEVPYELKRIKILYL